MADSIHMIGKKAYHCYGLPLTPCMEDCLRRLATGYKAQEIADKRGTSRRTVEAIIAAAKSRLGAKTTTQAVVMWVMREDEE